MASNDQHLSHPPPSPPSADDTDRLLIDLHVARAAVDRATTAARQHLDNFYEAYDADIRLVLVELNQVEAAVTRAIGRRRAQL